MKKNDTKTISKFSNLCVDTLRILGVEMIEKAKSGHPGIVLGASPILYALFREHMVVDVKHPNFLNRDRFILSAGHGSALLYATMHIAGYENVSLHDLQNFRNINSKTAGHPENTLLDGIDCTTGPLGQGVGLAVGMAIAETKLSSYFKKYKLFNHHTYCLFGDGCFEEGVFTEALSIASKYQLNKLIFLYDSNGIQLDGKVSDSTITNTKKYFESLNLNYIKVDDGNNVFDISEAIALAKQSKDKPTVIEVKTKIGYGSVYENSNKAHGSPLNQQQVEELKNKLSYHNEKFEISRNVYGDFENLHKRGEKAYLAFNQGIELLKNDEVKYKEFLKIINKSINVDKKEFKNLSYENNSTRNIAGEVVNIIAKNNPLLSIVNADIASSTKIISKDGGFYSKENPLGMNINVGVREFAMTCIASGISIHSGLKAMCSTFLSFSDYNKASIRLAAISHNPIISFYSHDSISVGEDGPTHQPIEQLWSLRLIPNHNLIRPCNLNEVVDSISLALESDSTPTTICLSRNEFIQLNKESSKLSKGAYKIYDIKGNDIIIISTGSDIEIAYRVSLLLEKMKVKASVVSMPCFELFLKQSNVYHNHVLDVGKPIISFELGVTTPWYRFADYAIGINKFGYSGTYEEVLKKLKLSDQEIADKIILFLKTLPKFKPL